MDAERSALVTGATGFVGQHLVAQLRRRGWRVVALHRPASAVVGARDGSESETVTLHDASELPVILDRVNVDTVFHLAAHQSRGHGVADIDAFVEANIRLGMHLFSAAAERGIRVIDALSYFQFRDNAPAPHSLYSATKQAQAEFARFWRDRLGADIRDVVLFDNYGTGDGRDKLVPALVRAARTGEPLVIGPLEQAVDLVHVRDVAAGLIAAADSRAQGPFAIRAQELITVGGIVECVQAVAGVPVPFTVDPDRRVSDGAQRAVDWDRPTGWSPKVTLPEGIAECVAAAG